MKYPFVARTPSDPHGDKGGLGYMTREEAEGAAAQMNRCIEFYPVHWNTDFWKTKPEPWQVYEEKE